MLLFCQWEAHSLGSEDVWAPIFCWWCCTWCSCSSGPGRTNLIGGNILVSFETFGGLWFDLPPARTASSPHPVLRGRTPRCTLKTMLKFWRFPFWPISYNHQTILTFCPKCWPGKDPGWSTQRLVRWTHTKCTDSEPGIYINIIVNNQWCDHISWWRARSSSEVDWVHLVWCRKKIWL